MTQQQKQNATKWIKQGYSLISIAKELGFCVGSIYLHAWNTGLMVRKPHKKRLAK